MQSAYYTPIQLVNIMVKAAVQNVNPKVGLKNIRILDLAAGAGVFLINAFRELVAQRWQIDGKRPGTKILRSILEYQITGFEVDESALRYSALGLYMISLELDPNPKLNSDSKFKNLHRIILKLRQCDSKLTESHVYQYQFPRITPILRTIIEESFLQILQSMISDKASSA